MSRTSTSRWRPSPVQIRHLVDRAVRIAQDQRTVTCLIIPNDVAEMPAVETPPRAHGTIHSGVGYSRADDRAVAGRPAARRRAAERGREGRDAGRRGRARRGGRGDRGRRAARRRRREGAARKGRASGRPAVRDRLDRAARDQAELGPDDGMRHPADGRLELPVLRVPAGGGQGARGADRHRRTDDRDPLPDGGPRSSATVEGDAPGADPAAGAQGGPRVARGGRARDGEVVGADGGAGARERRSDQSRSGCSSSSPSGCPTTRSSAPTRARPRTGSRAT